MLTIFYLANLKGCPTNRMSLILSSNLLSHKDGWAANKFDKTLLENVGKLSAFKDSHSFAKLDDKLCRDNKIEIYQTY